MAVQRLGQPSLDWAAMTLAAHPEADPSVLAENLHRHSARAASLDGAVAGTPFLIALVPGYVSYLWTEAMMVLRTAALHGRDPRMAEGAAELLVLRGVHRNVEAASAALKEIQATPLPAKPASRRSPRVWIRSVYTILVLGGFVSPRGGEKDRPRRHERLFTVAGVVFGALTWVLTFVFPVTLMSVMAWGCERDARDLGRRALSFYSGSEAVRGLHRQRPASGGPAALLRSAVVLLSIAVPIAFIAYADRVRNKVGLNAVSALGALVALSVVIAVSVSVLNRR